MKVVMKLPLAASIAIQNDIRNFHYTDGGVAVTTINFHTPHTTPQVVVCGVWKLMGT